MTLIVEIEEFLKAARCHIVDASGRDSFVVICMPRSTNSPSNPEVSPPGASGIGVDDDDLITWEDAAWQ